MKKISDWLKTWTVPQAIAASVAMACVTAMGIVITLHDDWGKLVHWLAQPDSMTLLAGIVLGLVTLYHRALKTPVALLLALALGASVSACGGPQLSPTQRTDLATETQRCLIAERFIVDRVGTTAEEDAAALATERARCDAARAAIVGGGR